MPQKLKTDQFGKKPVLTRIKLTNFTVVLLKKILALEENGYNVVARDGSMKIASIRTIRTIRTIYGQLYWQQTLSSLLESACISTMVLL